MLDKNKDLLFQDGVDLLSTSTNAVVKELFSFVPLYAEEAKVDDKKRKESQAGNKRPETTCVQYKKSVTALMDDLNRELFCGCRCF